MVRAHKLNRRRWQRSQRRRRKARDRDEQQNSHPTGEGSEAEAGDDDDEMVLASPWSLERIRPHEVQSHFDAVSAEAAREDDERRAAERRRQQEQADEAALLEERRRRDISSLCDRLAEAGPDSTAWFTPSSAWDPERVCRRFQLFGWCAETRYACPRYHPRPVLSKVLLLAHLFHDAALDAHGAADADDANLEHEPGDEVAAFREFFWDVYPELRGPRSPRHPLRRLITCQNASAHLRGHVYVEYVRLRDAAETYRRLNGRWFGGRRVRCEFVKVDSWARVVCQKHVGRRTRCVKGRHCRYLHPYENPVDVERGGRLVNRREK